MKIVIIACGIIIYYIFREWVRQRNNRLPLERLTAEQIVELHRIELEAESAKRSTADFKIWYLRVALPVLCGSLMFLVGLLIYWGWVLEARRPDIMNSAEAMTYTLTVIGAAVGVLVDFIVELRLSRKSAQAKDADN